MSLSFNSKRIHNTHIKDFHSVWKNDYNYQTIKCFHYGLISFHYMYLFLHLFIYSWEVICIPQCVCVRVHLCVCVCLCVTLDRCIILPLCESWDWTLSSTCLYLLSHLANSHKMFLKVSSRVGYRTGSKLTRVFF